MQSSERTRTPPIERLRSFLLMEDGWLDGSGQKPDPIIINFLIDNWDKIFGDIVLSPYIYPTPTGGIQLEWETGKELLDLEIPRIEESEYFVMKKSEGSPQIEGLLDGRIDLSNKGGWDILRILVNTLR